MSPPNDRRRVRPGGGTVPGLAVADLPRGSRAAGGPHEQVATSAEPRRIDGESAGVTRRSE